MTATIVPYIPIIFHHTSGCGGGSMGDIPWPIAVFISALLSGLALLIACLLKYVLEDEMGFVFKTAMTLILAPLAFILMWLAIEIWM